MDDAEAMLAYRSNYEVAKHLTGITESLEEMYQFIERSAHQIELRDTWYQLVLIHKENNQLIGDIGIHFLADSEQCELGYTLNPTAQGKGLAHEAASAVINFLFMQLNKHRLIASTDPTNKASISLLRKLGFRQEAHFRKALFLFNEWKDDLVFALLKEEYSKRMS